MRFTGDADFDRTLAACVEILEVKGADYTVGSTDRLANFRKVAEFTGMTQEQVLGTYLYKHVAAIFAYIKNGGQSESEPIEGRISDVINYMLLFGKMVAESKRDIVPPPGSASGWVSVARYSPGCADADCDGGCRADHAALSSK